MRASRPVALSLRSSGRGSAAGRGRRVAASRERRRSAGSVAGGRGNVAPWPVTGAMPGAVALSSGCVAAGAGAKTGTAVAAGRGDRDATVHAGFERAVRAAPGVVVDVTFATVSERTAAWQAFIVLRNAADKKIEIRVEQPGEKDPRMKSRVGVFGDEGLAQARLDKIKANRRARGAHRGRAGRRRRGQVGGVAGEAAGSTRTAMPSGSARCCGAVIPRRPKVTSTKPRAEAERGARGWPQVLRPK